MSEQVVIAPTIGRVVLIKNRLGPDRTEPATVCFVWTDRLINVGGFDREGVPFAMTSLQLRQPDDEAPEGCAYAEWMGFQIGQSVKTEDVTKVLSERVETLGKRLVDHLNNSAAHVQ